MKVLIIANNDMGLYKFRRELLEELVKEHEVVISLPDGEFVPSLVELGCAFEPCELLDRHGTNPVKELKLIGYYKKLIRKVKPDVVLTYTIKPNIYGGMACAALRVPYIANITGLGTALENGGLMQKVLLVLYRFGLRKAKKVFFQNAANQEFMLSKGVIKTPYDLLPGSGVNVDRFAYQPYPEADCPTVFVTVGRIMKDKGADEVLYAARKIREDHPNVIFRLVGGFDGAYEETVKAAAAEGIVEYVGQQADVIPFLRDSHAILHASYHEGMANVLLEAASCGRPAVATNVPGVRETFDDGVSGISCPARAGDALVSAIEEFLKLPRERKEAMGRAGREKVLREFDRRIVVNKYIQEIHSI
jgi:galacturonosyltransferase